ncbi:Holliday junction branch migration protein RuvA [bacterium]|nr:Holliday junction branch migration protein RuvA [bacterium]
MYDYFKGTITNIRMSSYRGASLTLEVSDVGYLIFSTLRTLSKLTVGEEETIYVSLIHKEDSMSFVGFKTREERDVFNILQSVSGVGLKSALQLLDEFSIPELLEVVINENFKELSRAKGIGAKMAQKIILELKDKLINWAEKSTIAIETAQADLPSEIIEEAQTIMLSLGYSVSEIRDALNNIDGAKIKTSEDVLKASLEYLSLKG